MSTTGGPATYPTVAAGALDARAALQTAATTACAALADLPGIGRPKVVHGQAFDYLGRVPESDIVGVEIASTDNADGSNSVGPGRREQHDVDLELTVCAFRVTTDSAETEGRAWAILAAIDEHVRRNDPDLGHAVVWARVTSSSAASAEKKANDGYSGRATGVTATVKCRVIAAIR